MSGEGEKFVAALDVGTTTLRCLIYDRNTVIRGQETASIVLEYPKPGWVEINPEALWEQVLYVIKGAVQDAGISPSSIQCMGLSTQRCSFLCWDTNNNEPLTHIITWKDLRASALVTQWNNSLYFKVFRTACKILYSITKNNRYLSGSVLRVMNEQVIMRLLWVLENVPGIKEKIALNQVKYGTLDTYLVHKLTNGEKHVTDFSNGSPSGFFDPFVLGWADWALRMFSIPSSILPKLVPTCGPHFGSCKVFPSCDIPILCVIADQSSSMFGSASFAKGNVKVTLGTGAFLDVNTGNKPHASVAGIYPLVGWKYGSEIAYIAEGQSKDNGSIVDWGKSIGLYDTVHESSAIAESVPDSHGVYFIPAFNGLQAPYNDMTASSGFIGVSSITKRAHMVRALLESLAFRVQQLLNVLQSEAEDVEFDHIKVDGGVANNDFVLQTIANLTGKRVVRPVSTEVSALGCAFMAGVNACIWKSKDEMEKYYKIDKVFLPKVENEEMVQLNFAEWERALERFLNWSNNGNNNCDSKYK